MTAHAFRFHDGVMVPMRPKAVAEAFKPGGIYWLAETSDTSLKSMAHEFAFVREAWLNLPEDLKDEYSGPESLRKRSLIQAGWYDQTITDCGSEDAAIRVATAMSQMDTQDFAMVHVNGQFVIRRTAKSQSRRAMKSDDFQKSKEAVMEIVSGLIGVSPDQLIENSKGK